MKTRLPGFLLVGPAKTGSTSLYRMLRDYPGIAGAREKETHYFTSHEFSNGFEWYKDFFPKLEDDDPTVCFEASVTYFHQSTVIPQRIFDALGKVKIVCTLRNPVDRFRSHYQYNRALGYIKANPEVYNKFVSQYPWGAGIQLNALYESAEDIIERFVKDGKDTNLYISAGRYAEHLVNWISLFGWENVACVAFDNFINDPLFEFKKLLSFLEVPELELDYELESHHENPTKFWIDFCDDKSCLEISKSDLNFLTDYYRSHNERLFNLLGCDFGWNDR